MTGFVRYEDADTETLEAVLENGAQIAERLIDEAATEGNSAIAALKERCARIALTAAVKSSDELARR